MTEVAAPAPGMRRIAGRVTRPRRETPARPTDALSEASIRMALKNGHDTPKAIGVATGLPRWLVTRRLARLLASGDATKTGTTRSARYQLA